MNRDLPTLVPMCGCALSVMLMTLVVVLPTLSKKLPCQNSPESTNDSVPLRHPRRTAVSALLRLVLALGVIHRKMSEWLGSSNKSNISHTLTLYVCTYVRTCAVVVSVCVCPLVG